MKPIFKKAINRITGILNKLFLVPNLPNLSRILSFKLINDTLKLINLYEKSLFRPFFLYIFVLNRGTILFLWLYNNNKPNEEFYSRIVTIFFAILALKFTEYPLLTLNFKGTINVSLFLLFTLISEVITYTIRTQYSVLF